ncbi:MAG: hypothetical protein ACRD0P_09925 [Stackebrandtia sp.]
MHKVLRLTLNVVRGLLIVFAVFLIIQAFTRQGSETYEFDGLIDAVLAVAFIGISITLAPSSWTASGSTTSVPAPPPPAPQSGPAPGHQYGAPQPGQVYGQQVPPPVQGNPPPVGPDWQQGSQSHGR